MIFIHSPKKIALPNPKTSPYLYLIMQNLQSSSNIQITKFANIGKESNKIHTKCKK